MRIVPVFFAILSGIATVLSYRILGLLPYNGRSHFIMFEPLFKALAARGHEVDVLSHFPQKQKIPRYNDLSIADSLPQIVGKLSFDKMEDKNFFKSFHMFLTEFGIRICENAFNTTVAKNLRDSNKKYDLIFTEIFSFDCMYGFAHHFKTPVIAISTNIDLPWGSKRIGNPSNPSYVPVYFLPYSRKMTLFGRILNTLCYLFTSAVYDTYSMSHNTEVARNFFGQEMPHLNDLIYNHTSMVLINTHFSINYVSPKVPNFIEIAGIHIPPSKPLPKKIEMEMDIENEFRGIIYVSFGSLIAVETLPIHILRIFCEVFAELPYKVLWKGPVEKFPKNLTIPSNIYFEKWMPQRDILCHPNVKLFISHGGLMGTQESIYCGIPTLGLPIFADQELNIGNSESRGVALKLRFNDVTKETFRNSVTKLLDDPSFKKNAEHLSELFRDRPDSALDTAVYWTEYVLKYKGAPHLRSVAVEMPWYEYFLVDVIIVLIAVIIISVLAFYIVIKGILNLLCKSNDKHKMKQQ
ncbi:UDP-glucuronosyltransferase 2A3 [Agrilus planipennis]|uniref:UDP-glucuronosyltransferase n=1 Tax=Agrilus planipennis TaxID=224129 RepID=A0A1W4W6Y1_AGRPL|nr:UDP-glucuronosyltransferase 2A3 [Agrilus planipennis]